MTANEPRERLTYAGRRLDRNRKLYHLYMWEGEELHFGKSLLPMSVGHSVDVAVVEADDKGMPLRVKDARYTGERSVGESVTRWAALDAAAVGADEARKRAKRTDPLMEALGPIRDAYMMATPVERAAILTKVVSHITSYGGTK